MKYLLRAFQISVRPDVPTGSFLVACPKTLEAAWIDPADDAPEVLDAVAQLGLRLTHILMTHSHYDHIGGVPAAKARWNCPVLVHPNDAWGEETDLLEQDRIIAMGSLRLRAVETPGHTPGGMSFIGPGVVFSGDALFAGSVGGTPDQACFEQQYRALWTHLMPLPDETLVCTGHGPMTAIGAERRHNPFLSAGLVAL